MITVPNYALEGRLLEAAVIAGVRPEVAETDLRERIRAGDVTEANFTEKLAEWKATPNHHFFALSGADIEAEAIDAFGPGRTLKAQADYTKKHGEAKAAEVAALFGTSLGGKPGKVPEGFKTKEPDARAINKDVPPSVGTNPWAAGSWNVSKQGQVVKALGLEKAQKIARAAGSYVGATHAAAKL